MTDKKELIVFSITQAFSMQPDTFQVGDVFVNDRTLSAIVLERNPVNGVMREYYVGYDQNNIKIFEYLKETVNVHFY